MEGIPDKLFEGVPSEQERAARVGRFLILKELGYFGEKTNLKLALAKGKGSWIAQVRKNFSGVYQNTDGCSAADIENAALYVDGGIHFDAVFNAEASQTSKHLQDR